MLTQCERNTMLMGYLLFGVLVVGFASSIVFYWPAILVFFAGAMVFVLFVFLTSVYHSDQEDHRLANYLYFAGILCFVALTYWSLPSGLSGCSSTSGRCLLLLMFVYASITWAIFLIYKYHNPFRKHTTAKEVV